MLQKAREITDQTQRAELYEKAFKIIVDDAVDIWIYNMTEHAPLNKSIKNFQFCPAGSGQELRLVYQEQ